MTSDTDTKVLKIQYIKDKEYRTFLVTHFWGGTDSIGNLSMDLVEERYTLPETTELLVGLRDNSLQEQEEAASSDFTRIRHAGITIPMSVVPQMIAWMQEKYDTYMALTTGVEDKG